MEVTIGINTKDVKKALRLTEKQVAALHKRASRRTASNVRVIASKGDMGIENLRRKKVPRARVKPITKSNEIGVWFGLNDIRASEFKEQPKAVEGGVMFDGVFYAGYFLARFKYDPNPKGINRGVTLPEGKRSWVEIMIPIEKQALAFIEREIEPKIAGLFQKNFGQAIDGLKYVKVVR